MSETTKTPNYNLIKPNVNADSDLWGDHLNSNSDTLDALIKTIENKAGVVTWNTRSGAVSLTQLDVTTVLPPSAATPVMDGSASAGTNMTWSKSDHVHPTDTTRYSVTNPAGYVTAGGAATAAPVQSVATRTGAVVLTHTDITDWTPTLAPYAPLASPALTGSPTAPTVSPTTDASTKLATTAFVQSALGAVPGGAIVSATPPTANPGALWFDSTGGQTYVRYDDGNSVQWVPSANITGLANAAQLSDVAPAFNNVGRNLIHNSMFNIAQRGAGPFSAVGYTADRWAQFFTNGTQSFSFVDPGVGVRTTLGDDNVTRVIQGLVTGSATAGSVSEIYQPIEGVRRLSGRTVIVSFHAWAASGTPRVGVSLDQSFGTGGSPSASVTGVGQSVAISTTPTRYSMTFTIPSSASATLGTNGNDFTNLNIWLSGAANQNSVTGSVGVQTNTFALWGVQLEIAAPGQTQPTPLEKPDPELQLRQCQRFYQIGNFGLQGYSPATALTVGYEQTLAVLMRATPTVVIASETSNTGMGARSIVADGPGHIRPNGTSGATGPFSYTGTFTASADL